MSDLMPLPRNDQSAPKHLYRKRVLSVLSTALLVFVLVGCGAIGMFVLFALYIGGWLCIV